MFKWGTTQLKVKEGSYSGPFPALSIEEIDLIPSGTETPASTLQTGGRKRKRTSMTILVNTMSEYQTLYSDYLTSQVKILELKDGMTLASAMIAGMDPPDESSRVWVEFGIQFLEV